MKLSGWVFLSRVDRSLPDFHFLFTYPKPSCLAGWPSWTRRDYYVDVLSHMHTHSRALYFYGWMDGLTEDRVDKRKEEEKVKGTRITYSEMEDGCLRRVGTGRMTLFDDGVLLLLLVVSTTIFDTI